MAVKAGVPVVPATGALPDDLEGVKALALTVGYPLMLKASWGGGGRGMRVIETETDLAPMMELAKREALAAFGNDEVYLEKLVRRARHVEVQILGDRHGHLVHLRHQPARPRPAMPRHHRRPGKQLHPPTTAE